MSRRRRRGKGIPVNGPFVALPRDMVEHPNFINMSPRGHKLLMQLALRYNGFNNGDFSCAWSVMKTLGWRSRDTLAKAQAELIERRFMVLTRQGGRNKCNLYALTFWPIDECKGKLDVPATREPSDAWKLF